MWDHRKIWSDRPSPAGTELVVDSAAFLTGHLAEVFEQRNGYVPEWTWTNLLAHGTEEELRETRDGAEATMAPWDVWRQARSFLAGEVLAMSARRGSLAEIQDKVLVPLELDLAKRHTVIRWSPKEWVQVVEVAIGASHRIERT